MPGLRVGMPVMGITAVGKDMVRDAKYFRLACRIIAELGAQYVKTYYVEEGFETVTASCPVPIVMAGGKKLPELDALTMAYNAVQQGAAGVDMGRNIFQSDAPKAMIAAVERRRAQEHQAGRGARPVQVAQGEGIAGGGSPLDLGAPKPYVFAMTKLLEEALEMCAAFLSRARTRSPGPCLPWPEANPRPSR